VFQCQYDWGDSGKTLYVAEQVSHHPPVSAFYSVNRKSGWQVLHTRVFRPLCVREGVGGRGGRVLPDSDYPTETAEP